MSTHEHKKHAPRKVTIAVITVSTTRALADDASGNWIREQAGREGHEVVYHEVVKDDQADDCRGFARPRSKRTAPGGHIDRRDRHHEKGCDDRSGQAPVQQNLERFRSPVRHLEF